MGWVFPDDLGHTSHTWRRLTQTRGMPQELEKLWTLKGHLRPPRHPRLALVLPAPRLTRDPLRLGPTLHLSKSEVPWLADRGAALGHGT